MLPKKSSCLRTSPEVIEIWIAVGIQLKKYESWEDIWKGQQKDRQHDWGHTLDHFYKVQRVLSEVEHTEIIPVYLFILEYASFRKLDLYYNNFLSTSRWRRGQVTILKNSDKKIYFDCIPK